VLLHKRSANYHIILVDVDDIDVHVIFDDGTKLYTSCHPEVYHGTAANRSKLQSDWVLQLLHIYLCDSHEIVCDRNGHASRVEQGVGLKAVYFHECCHAVVIVS
jgi:hypothetical protein